MALDIRRRLCPQGCPWPSPFARGAFRQYPSYIFDGYITVFITGTILLGAITGLFRWVMQVGPNDA